MSLDEISFDFDSTSARSLDTFIDLINFKTGKTLTYRDIKTWDDWDRHGVREVLNDVFDLLDRTDFRLAAAPYDADTIPVMRRFIERYPNCPLWVISSNASLAEPSIQRWFDLRVGPGVCVMCIGRGSKKEALPFKYYVDDAPHLAKAMERYPDKRLYLMHTPQNHDVPETTNVRRVYGWKDLEHKLTLDGII